MRKMMLLVILLAVPTLPAWASQPGQPLDCSDWVFLEPGYSCSIYATGNLWDARLFSRGSNLIVDTAGRLLSLKSSVALLGSGVYSPGNFEIHYLEDNQERILARIQDRDGGQSGETDHVRPAVGECHTNYCDAGFNYLSETTSFDPINGRLLVYLRSYCTVTNLYCPSPADYDVQWIAAIDGFPRLLDVFQTYAPATTSLGFRVPALPEGLQAADHFDTYWGRISDLPDFTKAQPMSCSYPASPPAVGDFLTVMDTSPIPPLGQANYIVTAVTHETDRRYGRQLTGPTMTGRNPALLPACIQP